MQKNDVFLIFVKCAKNAYSKFAEKTTIKSAFKCLKKQKIKSDGFFKKTKIKIEKSQKK